jgi:hypothetical protein
MLDAGLAIHSQVIEGIVRVPRVPHTLSRRLVVVVSAEVITRFAVPNAEVVGPVLERNSQKLASKYTWYTKLPCRGFTEFLP